MNKILKTLFRMEAHFLKKTFRGKERELTHKNVCSRCVRCRPVDGIFFLPVASMLLMWSVLLLERAKGKVIKYWKYWIFDIPN